MKVSDFNYNLPQELIAQVPIKNRDESRLMVLDKKNKTIGWSRIVKLVKGDKITSCKISNKKVLTKTKAGVLKMKRAGKVKITIRTKFGARKTIRLRLKK